MEVDKEGRHRTGKHYKKFLRSDTWLYQYLSCENCRWETEEEEQIWNTEDWAWFYEYYIWKHSFREVNLEHKKRKEMGWR